jgi:hypothetical protein
LLAGSGSSAADADRARHDAARILGERRFHPHHAPRPFRGVLKWLNKVLAGPAHAIGRVFDRIARHIPGGSITLWTILAALVVALAAFAASRTIRRRAHEALAQPRPVREEPLDPRRLEREADAAERAGELERAIRLRFKAGLLRLHRAKVIEFRESLTSGEVARKLRSADFDRLARTFDEIVYGRRMAGPPDVQAHRDGWERVLATAAAS